MAHSYSGVSEVPASRFNVNLGWVQGGEGKADAVRRAVLGGQGDRPGDDQDGRQPLVLRSPDGGVAAGPGKGGREVPVHKRGAQTVFSSLGG